MALGAPAFGLGAAPSVVDDAACSEGLHIAGACLRLIEQGAISSS